MSREVKFRVWNKVEKRYRRIVRLNYDDGELVSITVYDPDDFAPTILPLERVILEQSTGLKDKNGEEIYDGDIVKCYSRRKLIGEYQVIWNEDCGGFECESLKPLVDGGDRMLRDIRVFNEISIQFRVIGNIHENPELLGGEE